MNPHERQARQRIRAAIDAGASTIDAIAQETDTARSSVSKWLGRMEETGEVEVLPRCQTRTGRVSMYEFRLWRPE